MRVIAQREGGRYLLIQFDPPERNQATILDLQTGEDHPTDIDSALARGYWEHPSAHTRILVEEHISRHAESLPDVPIEDEQPPPADT